MKKLTIQRSKWLRGEGPGQSYLIRRTDQKMCCLGFFGLACGLNPERMTDVGSPIGIPLMLKETYSKVWSSKVPEAKFLFSAGGGGHSESANDLMNVNDNNNLTESDREREITAIFAKNGIEVVFTD